MRTVSMRIILVFVGLIASSASAVSADRPLPRDKAIPARLARLPAWQAAAVCNQVMVKPFVAKAKAAGGLAPFDAEANRLGDLTRLFFVAAREILVADRKLTRPSAAHLAYQEGNRWSPTTVTVAQCIAFAPVMQRMISNLE